LGKPEMVERHSRMEYLQLPKVEFYQMKVTYQSIDEEETANTKAKLKAIIKKMEDYKASALISTSEISNIDTGTIDILTKQELHLPITTNGFLKFQEKVLV
jgi:type III restriction enzyme